MIKLFVDSASSITQADKEKYGVEILPLQITLGDSQYTDGVDITLDMFYDALINKKLFPKTSLPSLGDAEESVEKYTSEGYDVIILTMSSGLSGTYNTMKMLFEDNERVRVIDSKSCVGGIKLLVREINKYLDCSLDYVEERVNELIPRIKIIAVPETLEYLHRGGRLSRSAFAVGSALKLKPIITLDSDGCVKVHSKVLGKKRAMSAICECLETLECDLDYGIVPSYTYNKENLDELIAMTPKKYLPNMLEYDNVAPVVACHWGPGAFGYMFVGKKN